MEGLFIFIRAVFSSGTFLFNCVCSKVTYHGCGEGHAGYGKTGAESGKDIGNLFYDPSSATVWISSGWMHIREAGCRRC